jgi:hypothetical protein
MIASDDSVLGRLKPVLIRWELLRVPYNMILVIAVVAAVSAWPTQPWGHSIFWGRLLLAAMAANVCFCAGPAFDGYLTWLGLSRWWSTATIFAVGTTLAVTLAYSIVSSPMAVGLFVP